MAESQEDIRRSLREIGQEIARLLEQAKALMKDAAGDASKWAGKVVGSDDSPLDQIERLGELREKGFVTDEEFQAKKAELLKKIA
jgi:Short C-terminal domain